jgi:peptidoglycan/xylan/chitin deacetylase (PgdA/CDA1 family)
VNTYRLAGKILPQFIWHFGQGDKRIFLTFDDGPTADVTPWILNVLEDYDADATFFCLGKNVDQFSHRYGEILKAGHTTGNHTYSHLTGITTSTSKYLNDVYKARERIDSNLFRPPHGWIAPSQARRLKGNFRIFIWDVLSRDYNPRESPGRILRRLHYYVRPGSIVVFHDSLKAERNLKAVLPEFIKGCKKEGFGFSSIASQAI